MADSMQDFFTAFQANPDKTPHPFDELVENSLHWCRDVIFGDDHRLCHPHNFAVMRHFTLNLIRLDPIKRKSGLKVRQLIATTSDSYRAELLCLV